MEPIAKSLASADADEEKFESAKGANLGATATICRWRRRAEDSFGPGSDMVKHYDDLLKILSKQLDLIHDLNPTAMTEALALSREIKSRYGDKKEKDILKEDHLKRLKKDGPKPI